MVFQSTKRKQSITYEDDLFDMLLNSVCQYFIEDFAIYVHERDWPVILFFSFMCVLVRFGDECNTGFIE
jgi:hypothetical protein